MEGMEKRILLAIVLSAIILFAYTYFIPSPKQTQKEQGSEQPVQEKADGISPAEKTTIDVSGEKIREEKVITVNTDLYKAVFTNRGGVLKHWELKQYWVDLEKKKNVVLFDPGDQVIGSYPLSVFFSDSEINKVVREGLFNVEGSDLNLSSKTPEGSLSFTFVESKSGKGLKKIMRFHNDSYKVDVDIIPVNISGNYSVSTGSNFGIAEWGEAKMMGFVGPTTMLGTKVKKDKVAKIKGPVYHDGEVKWTALQDKYFISALIPGDKVNKAIIKKNSEKDVQAEIEVPDGKKISLSLFAGPKEYGLLKSLNVGLDHSISFGWFIIWDLSIIAWMAKGLFSILQFFYKISHNYGIAIILLTFIVRVVFIPLTYKSFKSMKGLQTLQPEIQKLQKKYKDDRAELNKAMMELYKNHKVNPLGGCLPMVLQLPVFIGLYNLLAATIELRHSPLFLWIKDLSVKDPYYVMPIIMGITMVVQQKMTPTTVDPMQAKIMLIMPVVFTFFFLNFPSGLVLYWLVNNVLTIAQQYATVRYSKR